MPSKTPKRILRDVLENLGEDNFNKFKEELLDRKDGVRRNQVEKKGVLEVTNVMSSAYTERGALEVAEELLRAAGCAQEAEELAAEAKKAGFQRANAAPVEGQGGDKQNVCVVSPQRQSEDPAASGGSEPESSEEMEKHFIDKHRRELIQRVSNVSPILDRLLEQELIKQEMYDTIRAQPTNQAKIRAFYDGPLRGSKQLKDNFYKILEEEEKFLIAELKEN